MVIVKTAELEGALLDYWVARAIGWERCGDNISTKPLHRPSRDFPGTTFDDWDAKGPHPHLVSPDGRHKIFLCSCREKYGISEVPSFSIEWADGGPLLDQLMASGGWQIGKGGEVENYDLEGCPLSGYFSDEHMWFDTGTLLERICRAIVASKFGEEVSDE